MKIVLDTNSLIQSFNNFSKHHPIWEGIINEKYDVIVSISIMLEYEEILGSKFSPKTGELIQRFLKESPNVQFVEPDFKWNAIVADPDDNKFFDAAIAGNADFIVTNDKHFNVVKTVSFPPIQIISSDAFLELITGL